VASVSAVSFSSLIRTSTAPTPAPLLTTRPSTLAVSSAASTSPQQNRLTVAVRIHCRVEIFKGSSRPVANSPESVLPYNEARGRSQATVRFVGEPAWVDGGT
jgi:hypothetical protein